VQDTIRDLLVAALVATLVAATVVASWTGAYRGLDVDYLHWLRATFLPGVAQPSRAVVVAIDERTFRQPPFAGLPKVMWTPQIATVQDAVLDAGARALGWDLILPTTASTCVADRNFDRPLLRSLFKHKTDGRLILGSSQVRGAATYPHKSFSWALGGNANVRSLDVIADDDDIVRRVPHFLKFRHGDGQIDLIPGMAYELALRAGAEAVPAAEDQSLLLNFDHRAGAIPTYSLVDLLRCAEAGDGDYFKRHFADAVVLTAVLMFGDAGVLPLLDPLIAGALTAVILFAYRFMVADRDKRFLREAFSSYVSPNLVTELSRDPKLLKLGGERREVTSLFTDLEGFTTLVEKTDPQTVARVLNEYLDGVVSIVFEHDGTVDKIIGDAVSVIFSAPLSQPDHARRAVDCARAIDAFARDFTQSQNDAGVPLGKTRIGVNSGTVLIGNFGGSRFFDYTAHGDAVNTAARLEGVNKYLGTEVCIAGSTARLCPRFTGRPVGDLVLKGKSEAVEAFEPVGAERLASDAMREYISAYEKRRDGDAGAEAAFAAYAERHPDDALAAFHLARLRLGETGATIVLQDK